MPYTLAEKWEIEQIKVGGANKPPLQSVWREDNEQVKGQDMSVNVATPLVTLRDASRMTERRGGGYRTTPLGECPQPATDHEAVTEPEGQALTSALIGENLTQDSSIKTSFDEVRCCEC